MHTKENGFFFLHHSVHFNLNESHNCVSTGLYIIAAVFHVSRLKVSGTKFSGS